MDSIKIFVDCHVFDHGYQGTRTYLKGIYSELIKYHEFHFFLAANDVENLEKEFGRHGNVTFIAYKYHNKFLRLLLDIPAIIRKNGIDFAHFQYIVPPVKKCGYIVTTHDALFIDFPHWFPVWNRIKNTFLYRQGAKMADIRLTVSAYAKATLEEHFGFKDYIITPNAVDPVFFEEYSKEEVKSEVSDKYGLQDYIIYISRWEPRKNQQLLLKAFVDSKIHERYQLVFIGDNTIENEEYADLYRRLPANIKNSVFSFRKMEFKEMLLLLRGAKASVYPSLAEGFGIPPLEAIAAGIPTLCSDRTAMSDFKFLGEFLFNPYDEAMFKKKLSSLLEKDHSQRMKQFQDDIKSRFSWEKSAVLIKNAILQNRKKS